jgi:ferritin
MGYKGLAKYFRSQAEGETGHYLKFRDYLKVKGSNVLQVEVSDGALMLVDPQSLGNMYLQVEVKTSLLINGIMQEAKLQGDEQTQSWLQWATDEQIEEEDEAMRFRNLCATNTWSELELIYKE